MNRPISVSFPLSPFVSIFVLFSVSLWKENGHMWALGYFSCCCWTEVRSYGGDVGLRRLQYSLHPIISSAKQTTILFFVQHCECEVWRFVQMVGARCERRSFLSTQRRVSHRGAFNGNLGLIVAVQEMRTWPLDISFWDINNCCVGRQTHETHGRLCLGSAPLLDMHQVYFWPKLLLQKRVKYTHQVAFSSFSTFSWRHRRFLRSTVITAGLRFLPQMEPI